MKVALILSSTACARSYMHGRAHSLEAHVMGCSAEGQLVICKLSDGSDIIRASHRIHSHFDCALILTCVAQQETH